MPMRGSPQLFYGNETSPLALSPAAPPRAVAAAVVAQRYNCGEQPLTIYILLQLRLGRGYQYVP